MKIACIVLCAVVACSTQKQFTKDAISDTFVKDFSSSDPACTTADVGLNHAEAEAFFKRAKVLDYDTLSDNYPIAPCFIVGTLKYRGESCDWKIFAGATGSMKCKERETYFACDTCDDLFQK